MSLLDLYKNAGESTYVGRVRANQVGYTSTGEDVTTLSRGVNFFDGQPRNQNDDRPDAYQTELTRNAPRSFKYETPGQNGKVPGADTSTTGLTGLSRWTSSALNIAFKDTTTVLGKTSIFDRFKAFKGKSSWAGQQHFHRYNPVTDNGQFNTVLPTQFQKDRATVGTPAPSPAGLQG